MEHAGPNILLIICDDLAFGDLAAHGNPHVDTPRLDRLHAQSVRLTGYRSGPVCTPARAQLMTGRHHLRTAAIDTYLGRSMLHTDEVTLPELLKSAGYQTCISGKWHLGDCYPLRAIDRGFGEALVHNGGGLAQWANWWDAPRFPDHCPPGPTSAPGTYFDPGALHNGELIETRGYCTDVYTDHAIQWITHRESINHRDGCRTPWFSYLAYNAPHSPHEAPESLIEKYRQRNLPERWARVYAMVENIDTNVGRVLNTIEELRISDDTIVIFTSDHGPCGSAQVDGRARYNTGLRDIKGSIYDGGLRVPMLWRWPGGGVPAGREVDRVASPMDILPTLLAAACGERVDDVFNANGIDADHLDGADLLPLLRGDDAASGASPSRTLFVQWHRGDEAEPMRNCAAVTQQYKWCVPWETRREELYDLAADPGEEHDLAKSLPEVVDELRVRYLRWYEEVSHERGTPEATFAPPRIVIGSPREPRTVLTRQDMRLNAGQAEGWDDQKLGHWLVRNQTHRALDVTITFPASEAAAVVHLGWRGEGSSGVAHAKVDSGIRSAHFPNIALPYGDVRLDAWVETAGEKRGARFVYIQPAIGA